MNHELIMTIMETVIAISCAVAVKYLIPWIKNYVDQNTVATVAMWVKEAVHAAEQIMQSEKGSEKKTYVIQFISKILEANNIELTDEQIDVLIESAVKQLKLESQS